MIIYTDFNLNLLLQLFFSLSKQIIFFSPILTNNNLPLKIYCESIVKILWQYFSILISYSLFYISLILFYFLSIFPSLFFPLFFSSSTHEPLIFFLYFLFSSLSLPLLPHTCPYFFFLYFLTFPFHSTRSLHIQNVPHTYKPLSHLSRRLKVSASLFFFFLTLRKLMMMMKKMKMMMMIKKSLHLFFRPFSLFPYFVFPSLFFFFFTLQSRWGWWGGRRWRSRWLKHKDFGILGFWVFFSMDFRLILSWVWDGFSGFKLILSCFCVDFELFLVWFCWFCVRNIKGWNGFCWLWG